MPTRHEVSHSIQQTLEAHGLSPSDPRYALTRQTLEDLNNGTADLDDELASIAEQLTWLLGAPTWLNERPVEEFTPFVESKLSECERTLSLLRQRWEQHQRERAPTAPP
ncbi:MAG: hypothetical protein KBC32_07845 [Candidatus Didemnitutus sp.]|nr:hypothetical protein [Candidatus Didemnitutus sp.]